MLHQLYVQLRKGLPRRNGYLLPRSVPYVCGASNMALWHVQVYFLWVLEVE